MIDGPVALVVIGSLIQAAGPTVRIAKVLLPARAARAAAADAELARDPLIAGVAGIAGIYDRA